MTRFILPSTEIAGDGAVVGDVLTWDGGKWIPRSGGLLSITQQAGNYTFALTDLGTEIEGTSASAQSFTIPPNSSVPFPVGTSMNARQIGAGQLTIAGGTGVTLRAPNGARAAQQYSTLGLIQRAVNEWVVTGDTKV